MASLSRFLIGRTAALSRIFAVYRTKTSVKVRGCRCR